jgi:hypothetical protein
VSTPTPAPLDETAARQVLLLRAYETGVDDRGGWTVEDQAWATRLARESLGADVDPSRFVSERARHAVQRLRGRDPALGRWLDRHFSLAPWLLAAAALGLGAGVVVDQIGPDQRINLLAPPIWLLVLWNLLVFAAIGVQALIPRPNLWGLRQRLPRLWTPRAPADGPRQRLAVAWAQATAPLNAARVALLLHVAAALLALGVVAGLYLRGMVLDYRVAWQSTFLDAPAVHRVLQVLLAPAAAATGIDVPGVASIAALRVTAGTAAQGPGGPWLHLYATTLALFVIGPRLLLAAAAGWRTRRLGARWALPWHEPYFQALLQAGQGQVPTVWVLPHGAALAAPSMLGLRALLGAALGPDLRLQVAEPVAHGDEDDLARCTPPADATIALVLVDLASTPEAEAQGRLLQTLAQAAARCTRVLLVDASAFTARFAHLPQRLQERRQAWQDLAGVHGVPWLAETLAAPTPAPETVAALRRLLGR